MVAGHDIGGEMILGVLEATHDDARLTDLNPLKDSERCVPGCPGWFVNSENGKPESCDECARTAAARRLQPVSDDAAFETWREMMRAAIASEAAPGSVDVLLPEVS